MNGTNDEPEIRRRWPALLMVVLGSLLASVLIVVGAVRFLDQAQRQADQVECIRVGVQQQAQDNAVMASVVLDAGRPVADRANAVATWRDAQQGVADRIGRC